MGLLQNIKNQIFNRALQQQGRQNQTERVFVGFEKAQSIGILFDATDLENRTIITQYAEKLSSNNKRVKLLGFFDSKLDDPNFTFRYFNQKQLDWAGRPQGENVLDFIQQPFDIMLNLDTKSKPQADYISAQSRAHFRIGPVTENTFCYELMIDISGSQNFQTFIHEMESILEKTNSRQHEKTPI